MRITSVFGIGLATALVAIAIPAVADDAGFPHKDYDIDTNTVLTEEFVAIAQIGDDALGGAPEVLLGSGGAWDTENNVWSNIGSLSNWNAWLTYDNGVLTFEIDDDNVRGQGTETALDPVQVQLNNVGPFTGDVLTVDILASVDLDNDGERDSLAQFAPEFWTEGADVYEWSPFRVATQSADDAVPFRQLTLPGVNLAADFWELEGNFSLLFADGLDYSQWPDDAVSIVIRGGTIVPEPASMMLLGLGLSGLALRGIQRRRS